ncbi:hypothetical protein LLG95_18455 [bacterium]|nr:hypothetical protein [bacterium]
MKNVLCRNDHERRSRGNKRTGGTHCGIRLFRELTSGRNTNYWAGVVAVVAAVAAAGVAAVAPAGAGDVSLTGSGSVTGAACFLQANAEAPTKATRHKYVNQRFIIPTPLFSKVKPDASGLGNWCGVTSLRLIHSIYTYINYNNQEKTLC